MQAGAVFPPVIVFEGADGIVLADGFSRHAAADDAGLTDIECEVHQGTKRDAALYACGANATHGQRRTNADKRKAVSRLLKDKEWGEWTDRQIAEAAGVSHVFVATVRKELRAAGDLEAVTNRKAKGGKSYPSRRKPRKSVKAKPAQPDPEPQPEPEQEPRDNHPEVEPAQPEPNDSIADMMAKARETLGKNGSEDESEPVIPGMDDRKIVTIQDLKEFIAEAERRGVKPDAKVLLEVGGYGRVDGCFIAPTLGFVDDDGPDAPPFMTIRWTPDHEEQCSKRTFVAEWFKNDVITLYDDLMYVEGCDNEPPWLPCLIDWLQKHPEEQYGILNDIVGLEDHLDNLQDALKAAGIELPD
jgi:hypothetical protein